MFIRVFFLVVIFLSLSKNYCLCVELSDVSNATGYGSTNDSLYWLNFLQSFFYPLVNEFYSLFLTFFLECVSFLSGVSFLSLLYVSFYDLVFISLMSFSFWGLVESSTIRKKLVYYLCLLISFCCWGFYFSLDGFILLLLTTEFLIISLFMFIIVTNVFQKSKEYTGFVSFRVLFWIISLVSLCSSLISFGNFSYLYKYLYPGVWDIFASDLFIFFYTFFMAFTHFIYFFTLILSLFTIFFILFYFNLRKASQLNEDSFSGVYPLRKQNRVRQERFNVFLRAFVLKQSKIVSSENTFTTTMKQMKEGTPQEKLLKRLSDKL